jgi:hypothetical protein
VSGEPRSTLDIDMVVAFEERDAWRLRPPRGNQFYVDERGAEWPTEEVWNVRKRG